MVSEREIIHVYPNSDLKDHILECIDGVCNCPCSPKYIDDPENDLIVVHNSFDGREGVEWTNEILDSSK